MRALFYSEFWDIESQRRYASLRQASFPSDGLPVAGTLCWIYRCGRAQWESVLRWIKPCLPWAWSSKEQRVCHKFAMLDLIQLLHLTVEETEVQRGEVTVSKENQFPKRTLRSGRWANTLAPFACGLLEHGLQKTVFCFSLWWWILTREDILGKGMTQIFWSR